MHKVFRVALTCLIGTGALSCGGGDGPSAPVPVLTTLSVSFPAGTILVGQSSNATATGVDQFGAAIATGTVVWSTASATVATVNAGGAVTGVGAGQTQVIASAGGKQGQASVTVNPVPVASVTVAPPAVSLGIGATQQLVPTTFDNNGNILTGRVVTWGSSDPGKATVSDGGLVTGVAAGVATITATSEGRSGTSQITVTGPTGCSSSNALQLSLGEVRRLTSAEVASLCLGGGAFASEYALIPFSSNNVAAATVQLQITSTNTSAIQPGSLASLQPRANQAVFGGLALPRSLEREFRERERRDLEPVLASFRRLPVTRRRADATGALAAPRYLTGIPTDPVVGATYQINANLSGNTCTEAKTLRGAVVVAVLAHTIVLSDETSPADGWTTAEMAGFGQAFEDTGYPFSVAAFGAPSDMDFNGRVAILFTPSVNGRAAQPGTIVGGLFASRDLFPVVTCPGSNEGEIFYMPVPDPSSTINGNYTNKAALARQNLSVLVHEMQHLINAGRRIYVNNASGFEQVWLNEGLSHIAEELLYYRESGNSPKSNIDLTQLRSSQAQLDAVNAHQISNLGRLSSYLRSPETNSPFAFTDALETRGATWQLLRYSADRSALQEQQIWFLLVNSRTSGQSNFNQVLGNIMTATRDWAVAQFTDDAALGVEPVYTHPSWNYRSILPVINSNVYPLLTRSLFGPPLDITLNGGGAAYVRFAVGANSPATISAASSGQPVPAIVEFTLIRTQ